MIKTNPHPFEDLVQEDLLQKFQERADKLSQQNRVIKFDIDAGFLTTVDVGKYFMTKDTEERPQPTDPLACREYILSRDEKSFDPQRLDSREHKEWIRVGSHTQLFTRNIWNGNLN